MTRILVTGAGGFIGQELTTVLANSGLDVVPVYRDGQPAKGGGDRSTRICMNVGPSTNWGELLVGVDVVVHLVAKTHSATRNSLDEMALFRRVNVAGTTNLASQAAAAGVKRFVYLSSIKVNGERTTESPFTIDRSPRPEDAYGKTKLEAENALRKIETEAGMELVIIRPPLVYGHGVKGNLRALERIIRKGIPLPIGAIKNSRSLVSLYNLCDLVRVCVSSPVAGGNTFLVADSEVLSTIELVAHVADGLERKARVISVPIWVLRGVARLVGKGHAVEKLIGDLEVDMSRTQEVLSWSPPFTVAESFKMMFASRTSR